MPEYGHGICPRNGFVPGWWQGQGNTRSQNIEHHPFGYPGPLRRGYILSSSAQDWINGWQLWHCALLQGPLGHLLRHSLQLGGVRGRPVHWPLA